MSELTSNPNREKLEEVEVMGRTVYVSHSSEQAYVEYQDELVSMTNLRAWNTLMERAKQQAIDGYDQEQSLQEKEFERTAERLSSDIQDMVRELDEMAKKVRRVGDSEGQQ